MNFLVDMPVSPSLVAWLIDRGHHAVHAQQIGLAAASDATLVVRAREENRVIITADLDFGRLLASTGAKGPGIILFRGGNYNDSEMRGLLERVLDRVPEGVLATAICVVDKKRVRVTQLPLRTEFRSE